MKELFSKFIDRKWVERRKNSYLRDLFINEKGERVHKLHRDAQIADQKFVTQLLFPFHLSPIIENNEPISRGSFSVEYNGMHKKISAKSFKEKFPEKFAEAEVEVNLIGWLLMDTDRRIDVLGYTNNNVLFYENGEYSLFDFENVSYFFSREIDLIELRKKLSNIDTVQINMYLERLNYLKSFYDSKEGRMHFKNIFNDKLEFEEPEDQDAILSPRNFYKIFMERIELVLNEISRL
jgi:hypothetical protein